MATKVYKNAYEMGKANIDGLSFPEATLLPTIKRMYDAVQAQVTQDGVVTTGPARILIIVEQEVIVPDDTDPCTRFCDPQTGVHHHGY